MIANIMNPPFLNRASEVQAETGVSLSFKEVYQVEDVVFFVIRGTFASNYSGNAICTLPDIKQNSWFPFYTDTWDSPEFLCYASPNPSYGKLVLAGTPETQSAKVKGKGFVASGFYFTKNQE